MLRRPSTEPFAEIPTLTDAAGPVTGSVLSRDDVEIRTYHEIPVITDGEFQGLLKNVLAYKATKLMKDTVRRYEYDNVFGNLCDDPAIIGSVYDKTRSNKDLRRVLKNKLSEAYKTSDAVYSKVANCHYLKPGVQDGTHLDLIQQLLSVLGLKSTHGDCYQVPTIC